MIWAVCLSISVSPLGREGKGRGWLRCWGKHYSLSQPQSSSKGVWNTTGKMECFSPATSGLCFLWCLPQNLSGGEVSVPVVSWLRAGYATHGCYGTPAVHSCHMYSSRATSCDKKVTSGCRPFHTNTLSHTYFCLSTSIKMVMFKWMFVPINIKVVVIAPLCAFIIF